MAKKAVKKKSTRKKTTHKHKTTHPRDEKLQHILVENFIALQKVMVNLSMKFENLSDKMAKLLDVFEISAKTMAEKDFELGKDKSSEELKKKLDTLVNQNKVIARGLTLLHEGHSQDRDEIKTQLATTSQQNQTQVPVPKPNQQTTQTQGTQEGVNFGEYQKSISSKDKKLESRFP